MRILFVMGTRPQIVKTAALVDAARRLGLEHVVVHTGQHYDETLSGSVLDGLFTSVRPDRNLRTGSGNDRSQITAGVQRLIPVIDEVRPDCIFTVGDSNPALVGAIAAAVTNTPLAHSEAGLRSGETTEPEERNRVFIDTLASWLFCSNDETLGNLEAEGLERYAAITGDLLADVARRSADSALELPEVVAPQLSGHDFCLFTLHRRHTAYRRDALGQIVDMLCEPWPQPVVWPVHPGVEDRLREWNLLERIQLANQVRVIPAVPYVQMLALEKAATVVVTDSVGVQVEAYLHSTPCVVLRRQVEYASLLAAGWSIQVDPSGPLLQDTPRIAFEASRRNLPREHTELFGDGKSAERMLNLLLN